MFLQHRPCSQNALTPVSSSEGRWSPVAPSFKFRVLTETIVALDPTWTIFPMIVTTSILEVPLGVDDKVTSDSQATVLQSYAEKEI